MTPEQTAQASREAVLELGGAYAECPRTLRRARQLGLSGWAFYVAGRGGALGDVRSDTVAAALGFIAPEAVADGWDGARRVLPPSEVASVHLAECCRWGVEQLGGFPRVERLVELTQRVVLAADASALPLFAAWRAMPVPDDHLGAQAAVLLHLLREHRGGAHLLAVRASGLSPLEAIIAGPEGEAGAVAWGWQPPYPGIGPLLRRRVWAEAVTDRIAASAYAVLSLTERVELLGLLDSARKGVRPQGSEPDRRGPEPGDDVRAVLD
ncbi:MAG TPA: hypothetical protein VGP16_31300 [Asanoa sp.]|jgi:hypothetical protein|nr:hypothetical protein [Asanoa sp.]